MAALLTASQGAQPGVVLRDAVRKDREALRALHNSLLEVQYEADFFDSIVALDRARQGFVAAVAVDSVDGSLLAFATARDVEGGPVQRWIAWLTGVRVGYIMTLGVDPRARRRGLAAALIERLCVQLRREQGCTAVELHCLQSNLAARALYARAGFQEVAFLPAHYFFSGAHHDAVLLRRELPPPSAGGAGGDELRDDSKALRHVSFIAAITAVLLRWMRPLSLFLFGAPAAVPPLRPAPAPGFGAHATAEAVLHSERGSGRGGTGAEAGSVALVSGGSAELRARFPCEASTAAAAGPTSQATAEGTGLELRPRALSFGEP